jgi:hypothetical protein
MNHSPAERGGRSGRRGWCFILVAAALLAAVLVLGFVSVGSRNSAVPFPEIIGTFVERR